MRRPAYLSPSSISKWTLDPNAYYIKYLSDCKMKDEPQTDAMSVGSAFDAYVKSFLYEHLFGKPSKPGNDASFEKDKIFEEQVQPHNRDFARGAGEHLFNTYRQLGALDQLMLDLGRSKGPPRFEMDIRGSASFGKNGVIKSIPFRVKPDLCYVNEHDATVIFDWKVNGYCAKGGVSPMQGFVRARRSGKLNWTHDECKLETHKGLLVNVLKGLEGYNEEWARQCAVGGWMFGQDVGAQFVVCIHQLACRPGVGKPNITVAEHVGFVTKEFQESTFEAAAAMWDAIDTKQHVPDCNRPAATDPVQCSCPLHVFRHLPLADSVEMCKMLDQRRETLSLGPQGFLAPFLD